MSSSLLAYTLVSAALAALLARFAPTVGWLDRPGPARKLQERPAAPVGGAVLLLVGALALGLGALERLDATPWFPLGAPGLILGGLAAFGVGLVDDLRPAGLRPAAKLRGQVLAGLAFAAPTALEVGGAAGAGWLAGLTLAAVCAQNAVNTFDNADASATAVGAAGFLFAAPALAAVLAGLVPLHLARSRRGASAHEAAARGAGEDRAGRAGLSQVYLGDSGSHLLGIALLAFPAAWPALALPALDLARVALERLRAGQAPWIGDRRHLAHRLAARGHGRVAVLGALLAIAAPGVVAGAAGVLEQRPWLVAAGLAASAVLHAVAWSLPPRPGADARGALRTSG